MATIVLQTAGAVVGGLLGPIGSAIGSAAGALLGYAIDRALIDSTREIEGPRLSGPRPFSAEEGTALPRLYGTARLGGIMLWATRFEEDLRTGRQGGKGGPRTKDYSYYANVAFALCEGPVAGVRRVWADGRELDLNNIEMRVHNGGEAMGADPLIEARQGAGNTPAYRGTAYVVFERFPLGDFGNRIPQFQFEAMRPVGSLNGRIRAVALLPGSTEYGLSPGVVTREPTPGEIIAENRHVLHGASDVVASLDELQALCPALEHVAVVVTWFGDDLRAGHCTVRPKVTGNADQNLSQPWLVSGIGRADAAVVSSHDGRAAYGGTPSDRSVINAIAEIKARGLSVTLYPFIMMDVPADNALTDPHSGASSQPPYPWRGRIGCAPADDKTGAARTQIETFCGSAETSDFAAEHDTIAFAGDPDDFGYRRMVLHYAHLAAAAGGVDAFLIGSELRELTTMRDASNAFPFVEQLCDLATDVRSVLGSGTKITYGADWSEYFGHQPPDGSGDAFFHLDPLWAHGDIDAVGIDNYVPLGDWQDGDAFGLGPDGATGAYDIGTMREAVGSGEGYDWYYASDADREARVRSPITDGAYSKPWIYRYKDFSGWWSNLHYDRVGGVEAGTPTAWTPGAKPIWFTELGCPAVDKGPNQPNVFPDAKSSEAAIPHHSTGARSDIAPFAYISAQLDHWSDMARNPLSGVYGGRMVDSDRAYLWAWDARPFPAFPSRSDVWGDGANWLRGHWLNGRIDGAALGDLINAILADHGMPNAGVGAAAGMVTGYLLADPSTARGALSPLVDLFGLRVGTRGDSLVFAQEGAAATPPQFVDEYVVPENEATLTRIRSAEIELPAELVLMFQDPLREYQTATARALALEDGARGQHRIAFPGVMDTGLGEALAADWLKRKAAAREQVRFALDQTRIDIEPGTLVRLDEAAATGTYLVTDVESGASRAVAARRLANGGPSPWRSVAPAPRPQRATREGPPLAIFLDLPMMPGVAGAENQLRIAVRARPWLPHAVYASAAESGFSRRAMVPAPAIIGVLAADAEEGSETVTVDLYDGELAGVEDARLLSGENLAALRAANGEWELLQFGEAEEIAPGRWQLGALQRGRFGTETEAAAGAGAGAYFVLADHAVVPAGLLQPEIGLELNWRIGPFGYDMSSSAFTSATLAGGLRASV